jgi:hypothetical protein
MLVYSSLVVRPSFGQSLSRLSPLTRRLDVFMFPLRIPLSCSNFTCYPLCRPSCEAGHRQGRGRVRIPAFPCTIHRSTDICGRSGNSTRRSEAVCHDWLCPRPSRGLAPIANRILSTLLSAAQSEIDANHQLAEARYAAALRIQVWRGPHDRYDPVGRNDDDHQATSARSSPSDRPGYRSICGLCKERPVFGPFLFPVCGCPHIMVDTYRQREAQNHAVRTAGNR